MPNGETEQITFSHGGNKYSVTVPKGLSDSEAYEWAKANKPKFAALNLPSPGKGVPQGQPLTGPEGPTSIGPIPPLQRNIPQERQNLTQAGREASPIQAKIGDLEKRAGEFANIAGITALGLAGPGVGAAGAARAIPSAERAGALIGKAEQAAAGEAVHLHDVTDIVDRALQLGERGHTTPKVINDLKKAIDAASRVDAPGGSRPFLGFKEARDFYSSATRLSSEEYNRMTGPMKNEVVKLTVKLGERITEAAARVGKAEPLKAAMKEYARAKSYAEKADQAQDLLWKALLTGAKLGVGYKLFKVLSE